MACRVWSTPSGAEGMGLEHERNVLIAGSPEASRRQSSGFIRMRRLWQSLSSGGLTFVRESSSVRRRDPLFTEILDRIGFEPMRSNSGGPRDGTAGSMPEPRAAIHVLTMKLRVPRNARIYLMEQQSLLYDWLKQRYPNLVGSEYLGDKTALGASWRGIPERGRHPPDVFRPILRLRPLLRRARACPRVPARLQGGSQVPGRRRHLPLHRAIRPQQRDDDRTGAGERLGGDRASARAPSIMRSPESRTVESCASSTSDGTSSTC